MRKEQAQATDGRSDALGFFAVCSRGLQDPLAQELRNCGATLVQSTPGGVAFSGTLATAYAVNLHSRLASRVLWRLAAGPCRDEQGLYEMARAVAWEDQLQASQSLRVEVTANRSPFRSLQFATLRIKDAVVDRMRDRCGERPSIARSDPDVQVFAHLSPQHAELYLDLSGEPLFKRGWRLDKGEAPLKENLAAGLLACSGWSPEMPLHDPFCGSGTIAIEAACIAMRLAPGLSRRFAFERLRGFDSRAWRELLGRAREAIQERAEFRVSGSDISTQVIQTAIANAQRAKLGAVLNDGRLALLAADARSAPAPAPSGWIVTNPPYGRQSEPKSATVARLMGAFGDQLKRAYPDWNAWLLSGDLDLPAQMRLKESRRVVLYNGPIECRLFRFELVAGSYRRERLSTSQ
ncbi:MAG: class I SAM-dependent RNA methyltransferase [Burkholderiaceae bacterium]|nr:class I SAM-dependent RNA methyltransferase [Burkholderiaceae bacterium]